MPYKAQMDKYVKQVPIDHPIQISVLPSFRGDLNAKVYSCRGYCIGRELQQNNHWWRTKRRTKVVEKLAAKGWEKRPGGTYNLLELVYLVSCEYHDTLVVQCDYDTEMITLDTSGFFTKTTRERMNACARIYGFDYHVFTHKKEWFVTLASSTQDLQNSSQCWFSSFVIPFESGMQIPMRIITPDLKIAADPHWSRRYPVCESLLHVQFSLDEKGTLTVAPGKVWRKKITKHLGAYDQKHTGVFTFEGKEALRIIKIYLFDFEEGYLRLGNVVERKLSVKSFMSRFVGYDAELWLVK